VAIGVVSASFGGVQANIFCRPRGGCAADGGVKDILLICEHLE
jgi:hypothetical protein